MMKLIRAQQAPQSQVNQFLKQNKSIHHESLLADGYVIEVNESLIGCFVLEPLSKAVYWLKQLYIVQAEALRIPVLMEAILEIAKEAQAHKVFVNSEQKKLDLILKALQFYPQLDCEELAEQSNYAGKWWSYQVS